MQSQSAAGPLLSISAGDGEVLRSLLEWLRHEDTLRGRVRTASAPVRPGEMGAGIFDVLVVALGSGGAGAALATSVTAWLSQPRRTDVKLTMTTETGRPDPARSRALLIGASHFTLAGPDLPGIPAVQANLTALRQALTSPDTGVLRPESCRVLADPATVDEVGTALSELAAAATDLLLVYYAGHGLVDDRGRLHLALAHTHPHRARWTAFPLELLREEIANSAAATRVLILDCCFSGRAIEAMADDQEVISGQLEVAGTYTTGPH